MRGLRRAARSSSESLREGEILTLPTNYVYVQALKFLQTKATPEGARRSVQAATRPASDPQGLMQGEGDAPGPSNPGAPVPATDDEIREKYLERAIREMNALTRDIQSCRHCPRGSLMPVLGSGHPQADVLLLKYAPQVAEIEEGVAFYGRSGHRAAQVARAPAASTRSPSTARSASSARSATARSRTRSASPA